MMKTIHILSAAALLLAGGCSEAERGAGYGSLRFRCTAQTEMEMADDAASRTATAPAGDDFALRLTGDGYDERWERVADFNAEAPQLQEGRYTATVSWGDPADEGIGCEAYAGSEQITIVARRTTEHTVVARPANAQVLVRTTQQFRDYYHDSRFTLTTGAGRTFEIAPDAAGYVEEPIAVEAATHLTVEGHARRQSPTGTDEGPEVTLGPERLDATQRGKCHIFLFDARQAGGATLRILIGEEYTEEREINCELNEDSK